MKPEELISKLPTVTTWNDNRRYGIELQRAKDAETICSRLPSFEELEGYVLSLPHALTLLDVICEIHDYYLRRLKGEE